MHHLIRERFEGCLKRQSSTSSPTCHQLAPSPPSFNPNRLGEAKFHKSHGFKFPETAPGPPGPTLFGMSFQKTLHQISRQWRKRTGNLDTQTISFEALPEWKGERHSEIKTNYATELPFLVTSLLIWLPFPCKNHELSPSSRGTAIYDLLHVPSMMLPGLKVHLDDAVHQNHLTSKHVKMTSVAPMAWWLAGLRKITEIAAWEVTVNIW